VRSRRSSIVCCDAPPFTVAEQIMPFATELCPRQKPVGRTGAGAYLHVSSCPVTFPAHPGPALESGERTIPVASNAHARKFLAVQLSVLECTVARGRACGPGSYVARARGRSYRERSFQWRPDELGGNRHCSKVGLSPTYTQCLLPRGASGRHRELRYLYNVSRGTSRSSSHSDRLSLTTVFEPHDGYSGAQEASSNSLCSMQP
jgi:hypothetical protein